MLHTEITSDPLESSKIYSTIFNPKIITTTLLRICPYDNNVCVTCPPNFCVYAKDLPQESDKQTDNPSDESNNPKIPSTKPKEPEINPNKPRNII